MSVRIPLRAGSFYESSPEACRRHASRLLAAAELPGALPDRLYGGIVPHAGWVYSGTLAAKTFKALAAAEEAETFVLLGADHCGTVQVGEVYDRGAWRTPVGDAPIDEELAAAIIAASPLLRSNPAAHSYEHSLEVQVPIVQVLLPRARIVPIAVPPAHTAVEIGTAVGKALAGRPTACVVGSTDLTHHAGHFPAPGGRGEAGVRWTVANDRRMIDLMESMAAERVIDEAERRGNACGAGAVAAAIAACRQMGAARGICLEYTNSYQVVHAAYPDDPDDTTVGYASVVFA